MKFYDKYIEILNKIKEIRGNIASVYKYLLLKYSIIGSFKLRDLRKSLYLIPIKKCKITSITLPDDGSGIVPADILWYDGRTLISGIFNTNKWVKYVECGNWNTSSVTNMSSMFVNCKQLNSVIGVLNTSRVTSMSRMFAICKSLINIDVESFDTSNVTNMGEMFNGCEKLKELNVSRWNVSKVTSMNYTFNRCMSIQSLDFSNWDTHSVTGMTNMLGLCKSLYSLIGDKTLQDVENGTVALRGTKVSISTSSSPLRFSSILALANGLADLTGANAQTLTISTNSYNYMYNDDGTIPDADMIVERLAELSTICSEKNWNLAH